LIQIDGNSDVLLPQSRTVKSVREPAMKLSTRFVKNYSGSATKDMEYGLIIFGLLVVIWLLR